MPPEFPDLPLLKDDALLRRVQGNILKGHGRAHTRIVFFNFDQPGRHNRRLLAASSAQITWADRQLRQTAEKAANPNSRFYSFGLTHAGLKAAGFLASEDWPWHRRGEQDGYRFLAGMKPELRADDAKLAQQFPDKFGRPVWEPPYDAGHHGCWILANEDEGELATAEGELVTWLGTYGAHPCGSEGGFRWTDPTQGKALREPFGFLDGLSGAHFLAGSAFQNMPFWSRLALDQVLITDRGADGLGLHTGGSFLVLRKLEQNVAAFRKFEASLAQQLTKISPALRPTDAGALILGRNRDGDPLETTRTADGSDFTFEQSAQARCPFHAHIRKAHPRDTSVVRGDGGRAAQMVRRSVVYDDSGPGASGLPRDAAPDYPEGALIKRDVGLLFMAYMSNIRGQFLTQQRTWMSNLSFPDAAAKQPDLIGRQDQFRPGADGKAWWTWSPTPAEHVVVPAPPELFVRPRGGDFYYMPSLPWLMAQSA